MRGERKRNKLLANLLFEMAAALRFNIPAMEIFKGGYAPRDGSTGRAVKLKQWNIFTNFPQARKLCRYGFAV